jgi:hypothetical protein
MSDANARRRNRRDGAVKSDRAVIIVVAICTLLAAFCSNSAADIPGKFGLGIVAGGGPAAGFEENVYAVRRGRDRSFDGGIRALLEIGFLLA